MASVGSLIYTGTTHLCYLLVVVSLVLLVPSDALLALDRSTVLAFGVVATWRYGWWALHFLRSFYYRKWAFPRMRAEAEALAGDLADLHAFFLVTSFRIGTDTTIRVYRAAFEAAVAHPGKSTIIASIVEMADQRLVKNLFAQIVGEDTDRIRLEFVRIAGTGKRDALAFGFRAVARSQPNQNDIVMVIDGDSIVPRDLVARCAPFLQLNPKIGGLTTDEMSEVYGQAGGIFRNWYAMRFAQRQILMSSLGLSGRVLTLTGRMSMFRAPIVCDPDFIRQVEVDYIDHWRLGRLRLLTGDDKSSWFCLLRKGYLMYYLPDVVVHTVEELPSTNFIATSTTLMTRWFGNMLRTNGRAIALGPQRIGLFTWWCVVDQRISMWTSLTGLVFAVLGSFVVTPWAFVVYIAWILASRYLVMLLFLNVRDEVSLSYPVLLWYNQIVGSLIKTYIMAHMYKQKWTRQKTSLGSNASWLKYNAMVLSSHYLHALSFSFFVVVVSIFMGVLPMPVFFEF